MFGHSSFNRDPFRHLPLPSAFSYADYIAPPHINYPRAHQNRHVPLPPPLLPPRHRDHAPPRRREFHFEHDPSSYPSDTAHSAEDAYYHSSSETNSSLTPPPAQPVLHASSSSSSHKKKKEKEEGDVVIPTFQHRTIALPATSPLNLPFTHFPPSPSSPTVLILPKTLTLTHLRIHLTTPSPCPTPSPSTATRLHATVAYEMRLRDVIRQLLSPRVQLQGADVRAYVRVRGEWQEPGGRVRVCEVVNKVGKRGEVEVWVDVRGGRSERMKVGSGDGRVMGWETERGSVWEYMG